MMGQWVPALMWIMLQKLQEAALWLWQQMHGSWPSAAAQPRSASDRLEPAQQVSTGAAAAASSSSERTSHHITRVASRRELTELDQLLRVCDTIGGERTELA